MPCIRRHYNYGVLYLNPKLVGKFKLAGNSVDVVTRADEFKRIQLAGFVDCLDIMPESRRVKIVNISGFSHDDHELGPWIDYGRKAVMLGCYVNGQVWLVLEHGLPIAWCELPECK